MAECLSKDYIILKVKAIIPSMKVTSVLLLHDLFTSLVEWLNIKSLVSNLQSPKYMYISSPSFQVALKR